MNRELISKSLHHFIEKNQLTQEEFARLISAPLSSVSSWLLGKRCMSKAWQQILKEKHILPKEESAPIDYDSSTL